MLGRSKARLHGELLHPDDPGRESFNYFLDPLVFTIVLLAHFFEIHKEIEHFTNFTLFEKHHKVVTLKFVQTCIFTKSFKVKVSK